MFYDTFVDIVGKLPTILCEIDTSDSSLTKSYIYSSFSRILAQRAGSKADDEYFYVTDRLGSVRQLIDDSGEVQINYTYTPFGQTWSTASAGGAPTSNFRFIGQWYDSEIDQYYLRARMYDPDMMRFTSRDPVKGKTLQPLSLHKYLYGENNVINQIDPSGEFSVSQLLAPIATGIAMYSHGLNLATYAAWSGDWRFFDLADATFQFMPVALYASFIPIPKTWSGKIVGWGVGIALEELTHVTGMGRFEGSVISPYTGLLYTCWMLNARANLGDSDFFIGEMRDFIEWKDQWW